MGMGMGMDMGTGMDMGIMRMLRSLVLGGSSGKRDLREGIPRRYTEVRSCTEFFLRVPPYLHATP